MQRQNRFCVIKYFHVNQMDDQNSKTNAQTGLLTQGSLYSEASRCLKACFDVLMIYAAAILKNEMRAIRHSLSDLDQIKENIDPVWFWSPDI